MTDAAKAGLYHFSDDPGIERFVPRPVKVPSTRDPGMDWLNGPLVWAVSAERQATYLFPRDCPRILVWPTGETTGEDRERWLGERDCSMIAHIEWAWFERLQQATLYRYELPVATFRTIEDGWMWVSETAVDVLRMTPIDDLPAALRAQGVELRMMESLAPLRNAWQTSLHVSGIRLRNAVGATPH